MELFGIGRRGDKEEFEDRRHNSRIEEEHTGREWKRLESFPWEKVNRM